MAKLERYRWRSLDVPTVYAHDIRDYEIKRKDFTVTGTLDRRNGRWVWSPTLRLRVGDVVVVRPR